jgi:hypothetical protein
LCSPLSFLACSGSAPSSAGVQSFFTDDSHLLIGSDDEGEVLSVTASVSAASCLPILHYFGSFVE